MRRDIVVNQQFTSKVKSIGINSHGAILSSANEPKKLPNKKLVSTKSHTQVNREKSKNKDTYEDYSDSNNSHITYGLPNYFVKKNRLSVDNDMVESNNNEFDYISDD
ncbi:hypothetical protein [Acanthamoeba castellanii mimivirus]|uniref:Uncharacterized protein R860 n=5 Tax=Mimivirus TaxID=315393 RepID=YR860_MIMIV|nr:hypothetical protein MIMI_gp0921 [Acanthamoeba polyphaga mimivirus]Q5UQQ3.1 RecName: Full=Uncharacterized protein R860 [Acanthamoeba polyphaga mimivirus]AEQ61075.1 hypothetical protein [Acanthamoeba castellanii mamavirus]AHA44968.1 hypothetical protein HIRU_S62 [Hirudovirus strain Sangsue]AHJ40428.1 hypothetical protein [Samba virus]AMZ03298.1 hypothetical protein [Mimivirus Bombay]EJN40479.1 hypothetical protein lvs_R754 [Acanthamoeba polyphaga lentillevirus]BAV61995.1 hypothetical prote